MEQDQLFERLWSGTAPMEEWTRAVSNGAITSVADTIITVHSTYFCGSVTAMRTSAGLVVIDTANAALATQTLAAVRRWDDGPVHTVIYTHGHIDHTGGIAVIDEDANARGVPRPRIIAHRDVRRRLERYKTTQGFNSVVQGQQFNYPDYTYPVGQRQPDEVYDDTLALTIGNERLELFHGRGETDDATFVWLPERRVLVSGDFVIWMFPNAGNPRKVQRYAAEWAATLRRMQALQPEVLIPGHGPVIFGAARARQVLDDGATLLESLVGQTLALMNRGCTLDEVLREVPGPDLHPQGLAQPDRVRDGALHHLRQGVRVREGALHRLQEGALHRRQEGALYRLQEGALHRRQEGALHRDEDVQGNDRQEGALHRDPDRHRNLPQAGPVHGRPDRPRSVC